MSSAIAAVGLNAGYDDVTVVRDLNLEVAPGEVVALLGRNGAGKTTTLLTLAGALASQAGEVLIDGVVDHSSLAARARRGVSLVTDDRAVFFGLSARDNIRLGRGAEAEVVRCFPELTELMDRPAGLLSGGQQQMLSVGRALAGAPKVLLIDEMSLGLAPLVVRRLLSAVCAAAERGAAVLLVEQYARMILDVVDRAYLLVNGEIAESGSAAELKADLGRLERHYLATRLEEPGT